MRTFIVTLAATAGLIGAVVSTGAYAAQSMTPSVKMQHAAAPKQVQYSPHRHYWNHPRYVHNHHGYDASDSAAGSLNRQELDRLGSAPQ